ncbi:hypothetical protein [Peribacillus frigoritolerans]|jgi:hypothetical protein|nr:hypothetical protein [Peribacillus frigoritolerans]
MDIGVDFLMINGLGGDFMKRNWAYVIIAGIIAWYLHWRGLSND